MLRELDFVTLGRSDLKGNMLDLTFHLGLHLLFLVGGYDAKSRDQSVEPHHT